MARKSSVETVEREAHALSLRRRGMPYNEIASYMGLPGRVRRIALCSADCAARYKSQPTTCGRWNWTGSIRSCFRLNDRTERGDTKAIDTALKIMDRRAKSMGLDAPTKVQAEVTTHDSSNSIDNEVARLVALLDSSAPSSVDSPNRAV